MDEKAIEAVKQATRTLIRTATELKFLCSPNAPEAVRDRALKAVRSAIADFHHALEPQLF